MSLVDWGRTEINIAEAERPSLMAFREKIGEELETLGSDQADYIGVKVEGPFKSEHYRY
tara:strand:+ start:210 stop:386 length:177 start_codon:yes stop_codon:yes gene_type:complete